MRVDEEVVIRDPFASRPVSGARRHHRRATSRVPSTRQRVTRRGFSSTASPGAARRSCTSSCSSGRSRTRTDGHRARARDRAHAADGRSVPARIRGLDRLHSALSDGERYDAWLALRRGEKRIAVGARSAIFAPLANLGAIIVDEEHESSYKQAEAPRYHAREVAIVRARNEGAVVVLGSATPSLEGWTNAAAGKYRRLSLPERVGGGQLPAVEIVNMRRPPRRVASTPDPFTLVVSDPLANALTDRLTRGEQSILLLNRRGYASFVQCGQCGDAAT